MKTLAHAWKRTHFHKTYTRKKLCAGMKVSRKKITAYSLLSIQESITAEFCGIYHAPSNQNNFSCRSSMCCTGEHHSDASR